MPLRLIQSCGDGCPQPACGGVTPQIDSSTCVSRTGSAALIGWSKYQNFNSGDWNLRKFQRADMSFSLNPWPILLQFDHPSTCLNQCTDPADGRFIANATGTHTGTAVRPTITQRRYNPAFLIGSCSSLCSETTAQLTSLELISPASAGFLEANSVVILSDISASRDWRGAVPTYMSAHDTCGTRGASTCLSGLQQYYLPSAYNTITIVLSVPDSVSQAHARGSPTVGSDCRTNAGSIGSTLSALENNITITGTRSVRVTHACSGLTTSADYEITETISRYNPGGSFVDTITRVVAFTADGTTDSVDSEMPIDTTYDYEFTSAVIAAA